MPTKLGQPDTDELLRISRTARCPKCGQTRPVLPVKIEIELATYRWQTLYAGRMCEPCAEALVEHAKKRAKAKKE